MILRVPDYYEEFHCIADRCKDSCCIGWEIDIDDATYDFYQNLEGALGERLRSHMYETQEGEHSFRLENNGRCPFLNSSNLCDICAELGEEAFSEVCTEYPRFSVYYGNVLQKTLALSCEEVGRILFTREAPVQVKDIAMGVGENEEEYDTYDPRVIRCLVQVQQETLAQLQNPDKPFAVRIDELMAYADEVQMLLNELEDEAQNPPIVAISWKQVAAQVAERSKEFGERNGWQPNYERAVEDYAIFQELETLDEEWTNQKQLLEELYASGQQYESAMRAYMTSTDYREEDYAKLLTYFLFRYGMLSIDDYSYRSKVGMCLTFIAVIRDMDAARYVKQGGHFTIQDRIDIARIFSKEVEHSEENVAYVEEELMFQVM